MSRLPNKYNRIENRAYCSILSDSLGIAFPLDRRSGIDRRGRKIPDIKSLFVKGRRERIRRQADRHKFFFFDRYSARLLAIILLILLLSVIDSFFTLFLTGHGAEELNPIMAYFLNLSPWAFIGVKYLLTSIGVTVLLIFHSYYYPKIKIHARHFFRYIVGAFTTVVLWELFLMYCLHSA